MTTATMTPMDDLEKIEICGDYDEKFREADSALWRRFNHVSEPGDATLIATVYPSEADVEEATGRVRGVMSRLGEAGSRAELAADQAAFDESAETLQTRGKEILRRREKIKKEDDDLVAERRELESRFNETSGRLGKRKRAWALLESDLLLPKHKVQDARIVGASSLDRGTAAHAKLIQTIDGLRTDAATQLDPSVEKMRAENAKTNTSMRGHEYWKSRDYSAAEWERYREWASDRAVEMQVQADKVFQLEQDLNSPRTFYTATIE